MAITLADLTVSIRHIEPDRLVEDWRWLLGATKRPVLITALGDAFLQDARNGSVHLLKPGDGTVARICDSGEEFSASLADPEFVTEHFAPGVVMNLRVRGVLLKPGELYGFKQPPVLGGKHAIDNLEPTDISVHFALLGQLCQRVSESPPGTRVNGVRFE